MCPKRGYSPGTVGMSSRLLKPSVFFFRKRFDVERPNIFWMLYEVHMTVAIVTARENGDEVAVLQASLRDALTCKARAVRADIVE
jgi:hypothetical protein